MSACNCYSHSDYYGVKEGLDASQAGRISL